MGCFFANKKTHSDECVFSGAVKQIRTADLFLTKEVLCLLSYNSKVIKIFCRFNVLITGTQLQKKQPSITDSCSSLATRMGLEPTTSSVTG